MKKLIEIPVKVNDKLTKLAEKRYMKVKPYIEMVLIEHSKNNPSPVKPIE
jgi:hypothetical protein